MKLIKCPIECNEFQLLVGSDSESSNPVIAAIAEGFAVEVTSVDEAEDGYLVKCILSNYDTVAAFAASEEIEGKITLDDYFGLREFLRLY